MPPEAEVPVHRPVLASIQGFATAAGPMDVEVAAGDIVALRGGNGAGKTSLLRLLAGLASPIPARAALLRPPGRDDALALGQGFSAEALAASVQLATQDPRDGLVGLTVAGEFRLRRRPIHPDVARLAGRETTALSSGETRRVALAVAVGPAPLCLLDEPAEGLDAAGLVALRAAIRRHASAGGAVVYSDHSGSLGGVETRSVALPVAPSLPGPPLARPEHAGVVLQAAAGDAAPTLAAELALPAGFHVLTGPNGSGKTTLLHRLAGIGRAPTAKVHGRPARLGTDVRLLLSHARDALTQETVAAELSAVDIDPATRRSLVDDTLLPRLPLTLSGGQAQRVALCSVLGATAPVYLLDEPESFLDAAGRAALLHLVNIRIRQGSCILAATHDADLIGAAHSRIHLGAGP